MTIVKKKWHIASGVGEWEGEKVYHNNHSKLDQMWKRERDFITHKIYLYIIILLIIIIIDTLDEVFEEKLSIKKKRNHH